MATGKVLATAIGILSFIETRETLEIELVVDLALLCCCCCLGSSLSLLVDIDLLMSILLFIPHVLFNIDDFNNISSIMNK